MPAITLRDLPPELHQQLKQRAKTSRRSLNQEILYALELHVGERPSMEHRHEIRHLQGPDIRPLLQEFLDLFRTDGVRTRHSLKDLVSRIPDDYETEEVDWGKPVGREVW